MNREQTLEAIKVMQHYADGGEVEIEIEHAPSGEWRVVDFPNWNFGYCNYRIAKPAPKKVKFLAYVGRNGALFWLREGSSQIIECSRCPSADRVEEVEE